MEDLLEQTELYERRRKKAEKIKVISSFFFIIVFGAIFFTVIFNVLFTSAPQTSSKLFEKKERYKELSGEEKIFLTMYLLKIGEADILDLQEFSRSINEPQMNKYVAFKEGVYYIAVDFERNGAENYRDLLLREKVVKRCEVLEPVFGKEK